jgi:uncharacterized protein
MTEPHSPGEQSPTTWPELARSRTIQLTTFRRTGEAVPTPVWAALDGDLLYVTTEPASGKAKRIRHTARVQLAPCTMRGTVADEVRPLTARARVVAEPAEARRAAAAIAGKYRVGMRVVSALQRLSRRGNADRIYLALAMEDGASPTAPTP